MDPRLMPAILITLLSAGCVVIIFIGFRMVLNRSELAIEKKRSVFLSALLIIVAWFLLLGGLSYAGFFRKFSMPPRPVLAILIPMIILLYVSFSKRFAVLIKTVPPQWLVFMQSFRIAVELLLWLAFMRGLLPKQMTLEGRNFDILSGVLGLVTGFLILWDKRNWRRWALIYNIIGLGLLLNILVIAVLSMPTPLRYFLNEPSSSIVGTFPFIYLPGVLVVTALAMHIFSLRQIWLLKDSADSKRQTAIAV